MFKWEVILLVTAGETMIALYNLCNIIFNCEEDKIVRRQIRNRDSNEEDFNYLSKLFMYIR